MPWELIPYTDVIEFLTQHWITIGLVISAGFNIYQNYQKNKLGAYGIRKEVYDDYKERNAQLEVKIKDNLDEIHKTNLEVAKLQAAVQEKDKHIGSLTKILQGRNPGMIKILKEIKDGNIAVQNFIKTTYELLDKASKELGYQTKILENSEERNKKIDKASKAHVGPVIRIPPNGKRKKKKSNV